MSLTTDSPAASRTVVFNLPNAVTWSRLVLSMVLFALLAKEQYLAGLVVFIVAASTDWLDGYFARKYGLVTQLGRILDPFADKMIICGTYVFLAADPGSHVKAWAAVIVLGRELLVTALRSLIEGQGGDFSANMAGKVKMVMQCVVAGLAIFALYLGQGLPAWLGLTLDVSLWLMIALTVYSGYVYVRLAVARFRQ